MSDNRFSLCITLGNAEMSTHAHVAAALRLAADVLDDGLDSATIHDVNGNKVGSFEGNFPVDDEDEEEEEPNEDDSE